MTCFPLRISRHSEISLSEGVELHVVNESEEETKAKLKEEEIISYKTAELVEMMIQTGSSQKEESEDVKEAIQRLEMKLDALLSKL